MRIVFWILSFVMATVYHSLGANDTVYAKLDTNSIQIGQQTGLQLTYSGSKKLISFPALPDTFSKMEIVSRGDIDTLSEGSNEITLRQSFTLTSFDSGFHVILPFQFLMFNTGKNDSTAISTKPLLIQVMSVDVDTTKSIRDIKDIEEVPFDWLDIVPWALGLIVLLAVIWFVWKKLNKIPATPVHTVVQKVPADEKAMQSLMMLEQKSLWQQGKFRQYHTELTDILRTFITERWDVTAMEMTTDEILSLSFIKKTHETDGLHYILKTADLVKFAKSVPISDENIRCMQLAKSFIGENRANPIADSTKNPDHDQ